MSTTTMMTGTCATATTLGESVVREACAELQRLTGAQHPPVLLYSTPTQRHVLSVPVVLGGVSLQHFYELTVLPRSHFIWRRFRFEGSSAQFPLANANAVPRYALYENDRLALPPAADDNDNDNNNNAAAVSPPPTRSADYRDPLTKMVSDLRQCLYDLLLPTCAAVHRPDGSTFFTLGHGLAAASRTFREELAHRLRTSHKNNLRQLFFYSPNVARDWHALDDPRDGNGDDCHWKQQTICVELNQHQCQDSFAVMETYDQMCKAIPALPRRHITFVLPGPHDRRWSESRLHGCLYHNRIQHPQHLMCVIVKQELMTLDGCGPPSGFAVYYRCVAACTRRHCLRSDDKAAYISLLLDFDQDTPGQHAIRTLGWDLFDVWTVSNAEQRALERTIPSQSTRLWALEGVESFASHKISNQP